MAEKSLIEELAADIDELRLLHDDFGTRPYAVKLVAVKTYDRTDGSDKAGTKEVLYEHTLSPTPKVADAFNNQRLTLQLFGVAESGYLVVSQISLARYTAEDLVGKPWCDMEGVEVHYEIMQRTPATRAPERRRYRLIKQPECKSFDVGWALLLDAMEPDREAGGAFKPPYDE